MPTIFEGVGRLAKIISTLIGLCILVALAGGGLLYFHFAKDLPKMTNLSDYQPPVVSEVFAEDGTKIGEFWQERRILIPFEEIPQQVINAFVASEDERFWEHRGIDFRSIVRAFVENLRAGRVVQGGSTITQQVTRSLVLTREKSLERKIKEAILATQIEQNLSKEQILYLYLNQIYLGNRAYGVAAAAQNYFHKELRDLNLAEIALLAGLPSAPTTYSPINNPEHARTRQEHVLSRMLENGYIKRKELEEARNAKLTLHINGTDKDFNNRFAPYFVEHVRRMIEEKFGQKFLYSGGLKIDTTASLTANQLAEQAVRKGLDEVDRLKGFRGPIGTLKKDQFVAYTDSVQQEMITESGAGFLFPAPTHEVEVPLVEGKLYKGLVTATDKLGSSKIRIGHQEGIVPAHDRGRAYRAGKPGEVYWVRKQGDHFVFDQEPSLESALFSMNPLTGEIKAIVGGYDFKRSEFNRAMQAMRQVGSAFKPVVYAAALDKGYAPNTVILDAPVVYNVGIEEFWSPRNYSETFNGPMSIRAALTHSVNVIAVKVLHDIGVNYMVAYARKLGLVSPINKYLSSALGASDLTLQELTRAYGTFVAGGVRPNPFFIRKIVDRQGNILEENQPAVRDPAKSFERPPLKEDLEAIDPKLMVEGEQVIKAERLSLTADEKKILYGVSIPEGHMISPQTAFLMIHMMKDVVDHGTGYKAKALGRPAAGKTGTTNDESDAWFIGAVPDLITGVWVGYDNRKPIGPKLTGGIVAAPIWLYYMQEVLKDQPVRDFPTPPYVNLAKIDSLSGGSAVVATKRKPTDQVPVIGEGAPSRGIDFLYDDLNKL